jgi:hypothetical protein
LTNTSGVDTKTKLSGDFKYRSAARDDVLRAVSIHPGWVKYTTIAAEIVKSPEAARKHLQRLAKAGLLDRDGKGRYRQHRERQHPKLKPYSAKPIPKCKNVNKERKTMSRSELSRRGWPKTLID